MQIIAQVALGLLVVAHAAFFVLEFFWLSLPSFQRRLGFIGDQTEVALVGKNQAFSNLFLAAGVGFGWLWTRQGSPSGLDIVQFFLGCIFIAGLVGFATIPKSKLAFLVLQCGLAAAAAASLWLGI